MDAKSACNAARRANVRRLRWRLALQASIASLLVWGLSRPEVWSATGVGWSFWLSMVAVVLAVFLVPWVCVWLVRHRFQFSLKALLLLVLVAGVELARLSGWLQQTRKHREAVATLLNCGAWASYPGEEQPGFQTLIGRQYFQSPVGLSAGRAFLGSDMELVKDLTELRLLAIASPNVSDQHLAYLAPLTRLNSLSLRDSKVRGPGLEHVSRLPLLLSLDLSGSAITDRGLDQLRASRLRYLDLRSTQIGDDALAAISTMPNLTNLDLGGTKVTDEGLAALGRLHALEELRLGWDKVTDAGLNYLKDLKRLSLLDVRQTMVTESGIAELNRSLPGCTILWEQPGWLNHR